MGNVWMIDFIANFTSTHNGREPSKSEIKAATPLFLNIDHNPKGKGTQSWDRFEGYFEGGTTVGEVMNDGVRQDGVRQDDIRHDSDKRFILLGDEAIAAYEAQKVADGDTPLLETQDAEFEEVSVEAPLQLEAPKTRGRRGK